MLLIVVQLSVMVFIVHLALTNLITIQDKIMIEILDGCL